MLNHIFTFGALQLTRLLSCFSVSEGREEIRCAVSNTLFWLFKYVLGGESDLQRHRHVIHLH